jgi:hypothetical protein
MEVNIVQPDENHNVHTTSQLVQLNFFTTALLQYPWSPYTIYGTLLLSIAMEVKSVAPDENPGVHTLSQAIFVNQ